MPAPARQRIDKWLWFARAVRTREAAAGLVVAGQVRINRNRVTKPGHDVSLGDVVTVAVNGHVRVLRVMAFAQRRGPAAAARLLYQDLAMSIPEGAASQKEDASGSGNC